MYVTKLAVCLAAILWILELPAIAASAALVAVISAALELAALRVAHIGAPAPSEAPQAPKSPRARAPHAPAAAGETAAHVATAAAAAVAASAAPRLLDAHSMDGEFTLDDTPIDHRASTPASTDKGPQLATGPAMAVASVPLAPGMLDMPSNSSSPAAAQDSDRQTQMPGAGFETPALSPTAANVGSMAVMMAEDGWASEPVGGY